MGVMAPRRRAEMTPSRDLNEDVTRELLAAARRSVTGSVEVVDRATKNTARLYLFEGGFYAADLDGYEPRVSARLQSTGALAARSGPEITMLAGLDVPDARAAAEAVDRGWVTLEALANVHQEFAVAALGAVLHLSRVKVRVHEGHTTSRFCTLPLPIDPLFDLVRMRTDRLQGTWAMIAPAAEPAAAVLARRLGALPVPGATSELSAMLEHLDGVRSLDAVAWSLGFTRAEAVHVASLLVRAGHALLTEQPAAAPTAAHYLVPESFGTHRVVARPPAAPVPRMPTVAAPEEAASAVVEVVAVPVEPVVSRRTAPRADQREGDATLGLDEARAEVARLHAELRASVHDEQEAINRTAEVSRRLLQSRSELARLEAGEPVSLGVA